MVIQDMIVKIPVTTFGRRGGLAWKRSQTLPQICYLLAKERQNYFPVFSLATEHTPSTPYSNSPPLARYYFVERLVRGCVGYPDVAPIVLQQRMITNNTNITSRDNELTSAPPNSNPVCECLFDFLFVRVIKRSIR